METKNPQNSPLTKGLIAAALVLVAALIALILMSIPSLTGETLQDPVSMTTEAPTEPPTEPVPTLPPPEENPFDYLDFQYEGRYLKLRDGVSVTGIDVSHWQKLVDWEQVKESGVDFAMIRLGYRGYEQGGLNLDSYATANLDGAIAAGLDVGVYFFSQAITPEEAKNIMDAQSGYIILDARTQEEYDEAHIPGAIVIPNTEIEARAESELTDKDQLILVYCRSGRRSKLAAEILVELGYTNIYEFGGIIDWPYETE